MIALLTLAGGAQAATYDDFPNVKFRSNHDGDTYIAELGPRGSMPETFRVIPIRLKGVDTPEINHECKSKSWQARLRKLAQKAKALIHRRLSRARRIDLMEPVRGARFRVVARVMYDGHDLVAELLAAGLAKPAEKTRPEWCKV